MSDNIQELTESIYSLISRRILQKKKQLKKTRFQISPDNEQLLSNVMHNKRIKSRNPYLLNSQIIHDVVDNLNFSSVYELIWGTENDLDPLLRSLFSIGMDLLSKSNNDLIEQSCYEYLPYTRIVAKYDHSKFQDIDVTDVGAEWQSAKWYLYYELSDKWKEQHHSFFQDKGTKKLDKQLTIFINTELLSLLQDFLNETSHEGKKAYDLMTSIIEYENEDVFESISHGPEWYAHQPLTNSEKPIADVRQSIIDAGDNYINTMVNAQKELDPFFDTKIDS
jgi:hypothetical protein